MLFFQYKAPYHSVVGLGPHHEDRGERRIGDPHLVARQLIATRHTARAGFHAARIGAVIGFGKTERPDPLPGGKLWQILHALRFSAVGVYRMHHKTRLHTHRRAKARIHALHLTRDETIGHVIEARPAVLLRDRTAQKSKLAKLTHDPGIEGFMPVHIAYAGQ